MKKVLLIVTIFLIAGAGYVIYGKYSSSRSATVSYTEVINHSESSLLNASAAIIEKQGLNTMLAKGIITHAGVIKSIHLDSVKGVEQYSLLVDGKPTGILTVSPIELVKGFLLDGNKQVLLIAYDQGGNQCSRQYQILTLTESLQVSQPFGSCLPLSKITQESNGLTLTMPQNNPYLGDDITVSYYYVNGEVTLINKVKPVELKERYKTLTATQILKIAANDGCYQDGVMLDDNSCGNGLKYCTMFKNITKQTNNPDFKFLADFCAQP